MDVSDLAAWSMALDFIIGKLYPNSLLATLNTRQSLRSQVSGTLPIPSIGTTHPANTSQLSGEVGSSTNRERHFDVHKVTVIDTTAIPALERLRHGEEREV